MKRVVPYVLALLLAACGGRENRAASAGTGTAPYTGALDASHPDASSADAANIGPDANVGSSAQDGAQPDGPLSACSWTTPVLPSDSGAIQLAVDRTVLLCGPPAPGGPPLNYINPTVCLSASATECTPVSFYDDGGAPPCVYQCSPCMMLCAPNEYAIGVEAPMTTEGPAVPFPSSSVPPNCRTGELEEYPPPWKGVSQPLVGWTYVCCPCE